jgi:colicin import membrane protein
MPESLLETIDGNPETEVMVYCSPTGKIIHKKLVRSSGNLAWDEAVLNALEKTHMLPRDENGNIPASIGFTFRPRN